LRAIPELYATKEELSEALSAEVADIVATLVDVRARLDAGEVVDGIDDDMAKDILKLDVENAKLSFALATDGHMTLFVE
jgi:hypothetical protein